jgi:hypothetical protein
VVCQVQIAAGYKSYIICSGSTNGCLAIRSQYTENYNGTDQAGQNLADLASAAEIKVEVQHLELLEAQQLNIIRWRFATPSVINSYS